MERDPGKTPDLEGDDLFGNPEKVDHSIEEDLDVRLQAEQDEDDEDLAARRGRPAPTAEREGFEPSVGCSPHTISSRARSAAPAPLRGRSGYRAARATRDRIRRQI